MLSRIVVLASLAISISSCAELKTGEPAAEPDRCQSIEKLLQSYREQFADIRGTRRNFDRIDIWSTSYQLVGSGCEIWGWQGGKYNYVCNYVAPDEDPARTIYQEAATNLDTCATGEWRREEQQTQQGIGLQSVWSRPDFDGVVDLKLVQTRGISRPRWAVYLLIGDYNPNL